MSHRADPILARLKMDGTSKVGSVEELIQWSFESEERLHRVAKRDIPYISAQTGIPEKLAHAIIYSRQFVQMMFDELHYRYLNPSTLSEVYSSILEQLKSPEVPLGAKRSMLEFVMRQMGLEKPRKLSVKQQSEVVVRVEPTKPTEVLQVLDVPVEELPQLEAANPGQGALAGLLNPAEPEPALEPDEDEQG